jgi:DNA-binding MarR family transcriptional regulator
MAKPVSQEAVRAWAQLIRVEQSLLRKVELELEEAGLPSLDWYDVLLELDRAENDGLRHRQLHPRLLLAKYNLSRLIDRMSAAGLVRREPCEEDARGAKIVITSAGRRLRRRMWPVYEAAIGRHFAHRLTDRQIAALGDAFAALDQNRHASSPSET